MKKFLILIAIIAGVALAWAAPPDRLPTLLAPPAEARTVVVVGGSVPAAAPTCADSSCTGFLACQNFEGTGYDNSETWEKTDFSGGVSIVDPDYATSPMRGSQHIRMVGSADGMCFTSKTITSSSTVNGFMRFKLVTAPSSAKDVIALYDVSSNKVFAIQVESTRELYVCNGSSCGTASALTLGNTYYIWWQYVAGTGSNGTAYIRVGTSVTKPESNSAAVTNGTSTTNVTTVAISLMAAAYEYMIDQLLIDSDVIGDICE